MRHRSRKTKLRKQKLGGDCTVATTFMSFLQQSAAYWMSIGGSLIILIIKSCRRSEYSIYLPILWFLEFSFTLSARSSNFRGDKVNTSKVTISWYASWWPVFLLSSLTGYFCFQSMIFIITAMKMIVTSFIERLLSTFSWHAHCSSWWNVASNSLWCTSWSSSLMTETLISLRGRLVSIT